MANLFVITGNHLREGHVVYFQDPAFVLHLDQAKVFEAEPTDLVKDLAKRFSGEVTGIYSFEAKHEDGKLVPTSMREKLRAEGAANVLPRLHHPSANYVG